ncbi:MAG TPA: hypothetical protein VLX85_15005 [Stellaceae bacterium]|nr:hypothetical protein [Stellaceae bacterium]
MRHILGGFSVIALLAAVLPAGAQTNAPTPSAQSAPQGVSHAQAKPVRHKARQSAASKSTPDDNIANQLNQQELSQINQGQAPASGTSTSPAAPKQ